MTTNPTRDRLAYVIDRKVFELREELTRNKTDMPESLLEQVEKLKDFGTTVGEFLKHYSK